MENRKLSREDMIQLVDKTINAEGREAEIDIMISVFHENVSYPG